MLIKEILLEQKFRSEEEIVKYIKNKLQNSDKIDSETYNLFVHFSNIPKIGINPQSHFNTPLGIYSYLAEYIIENYERIKQKRSDNEKINFNLLVPFAGNRKYIILFSAKGNIIDLNKIDINTVLNYLENLENIICENYDIYYCKNYIKNIINEYRKSEKIPGRILWYSIFKISEYIDQNFRKKSSLVQNYLYRKLKIDGCIDKGGGIIHPNRPNQAVFFSYNVIKNFRIIENTKVKYYFNPNTLMYDISDDIENIQKFLSKNKNIVISIINKNENILFDLSKFIAENFIRFRPYFINSIKSINNVSKKEIINKIAKLVYNQLVFDLFNWFIYNEKLDSETLEKSNNYIKNLTKKFITY